MATATQAIIEAPAVKSGLSSTLLMDIEATAIVAAYQSLKKHGLEFGRLCYNFRKRSKVVSGGTTFDSTLDRLNIPHATAYRWIAKYEESIGVREPAPKKPVQSVSEPVVDVTRDVEPDIFAEALALPDVIPSPTLLAPKQEYAKNERGISMLKELAHSVSAQYNGECDVQGTAGSDNLLVTTGRYDITLSLEGVSQQRITNALKALVGE